LIKHFILKEETTPIELLRVVCLPIATIIHLIIAVRHHYNNS
jgi:hypothetical protein